MKKTTKGFILGSLLTITVFKYKEIMNAGKVFCDFVSKKFLEAKKKVELEAAEELEDIADAARKDASK